MIILYISEVLRSPPMIHYNRYLRRTFYYVDEIDNNNEIIRVIKTNIDIVYSFYFLVFILWRISFYLINIRSIRKKW
jgi:hypothetical protein